MKKKNGFTLIELLAVIIILGILMIIAIPSVTKYISDSRKNAYVDTAKEIIGGARNLVNEGKLEMYDTDVTYYIESSCIKTENALKSPYGDFTKAYVVVTYDGKGYTYYWTSNDDAGQGIKDVIRVDKLDTDNIESDLKDSEISTLRGIDGRKKTVVISEANNCQKEGANNAVIKVDGETGEESEVDPTCNGVPCICKRATVLHTQVCNSPSDYGCGKAGVGAGNTMIYGNLGTKGEPLRAGDALDCDVNGDGIYNQETERFYYVSSAYNTSTKSFDNSKAVLIYYANISNDGTTITAPVQSGVYYENNYQNWKGPVIPATKLPTTSQWSNSQIIAPESSRQILTETGTTTTAGGTIGLFTGYAGKAARLLTTQEILLGCPDVPANQLGWEIIGHLDRCLYLMENLDKHYSSSGQLSYWLETPMVSGDMQVYVVYSYFRDVKGLAVRNNLGVRPVIEVLKSNIAN